MTLYDRYYVGYAPHPNSKLWKFTAAWLGYDCARDSTPKTVLTLGLPKKIHQEAVSSALRIGFSCIFYPPFKLRNEVDIKELVLHSQTFCHTLSPVKTGALKVQSNGGQIIIAPISTDQKVINLASECVLFYDNFRLKDPPIPINNQLHKALSQRQRDYLVKWGNPYVFEEFSFSMPLTGRIAKTISDPLTEYLQNQLIHYLSHGLTVDGLYLFGQKAGSEPARLLNYFPFKKKAMCASA